MADPFRKLANAMAGDPPAKDKPAAKPAAKDKTKVIGNAYVSDPRATYKPNAELEAAKAAAIARQKAYDAAEAKKSKR
jgi:hypothetical protein